MHKEREPIVSSTGCGKMSPQVAVGYGEWADEMGRQTKHRKLRPRGAAKVKTLRSHRNPAADIIRNVQGTAI